MDNIFDGSSIAAVDIEGQAGNQHARVQPVLQQHRPTSSPRPPTAIFPGNVGAVFGNPEFVDAATGNFELQPDSAAIDAARSEIGPIPGADAIYPTVDQLLSDQYGTRTDPATVRLSGTARGFQRCSAASATSRIRARSSPCRDPESFSFQDEWVPALTTAANSYGGPSTGAAIPGTYNYTPISGQRDVLGLIRIDDPSVPNTGYGKYPFFDIGAYQYVNLHPPEVTGVTATIATSTDSGQFLHRGRQVGSQPDPANDRRAVQQPDRSQHTELQHGRARGAGSHR